MTEPKYVRYEIKVTPAERWMDRPIKVEFRTRTPAGMDASVVYLDEVERDVLVAALSASAVPQGGEPA